MISLQEFHSVAQWSQNEIFKKVNTVIPTKKGKKKQAKQNTSKKQGEKKTSLTF